MANRSSSSAAERERKRELGRLPTKAAGVPHSIGVAPIAGAASGAVAGAAMGAFGGPAGILAGAALGAMVGRVVGEALVEGQTDEGIVDEKLDRDIGVIGGDLGAADPNAPKSLRGTFSAASAGVGGSGGDGSAPDEGPMPKAD